MTRKFKQPSAEEITARQKMYERADQLGIDLMKFDNEIEMTDEEHESYIKALILLESGEEIPQEIIDHLPTKVTA